jgi:hypothetical protein
VTVRGAKISIASLGDGEDGFICKNELRNDEIPEEKADSEEPCYRLATDEILPMS